jgi:hypothetical protein
MRSPTVLGPGLGHPRLVRLALTVVLLALALLALGEVAPESTSQQIARAATTCGKERWAVKTLSDPAADQVDFTPKSTAVTTLRNKPAPHVGSNTPRIQGVETTTWKVRAKLLEFAREDDHDIHLVIGAASSPSKTMIVEFPDVSCPGARSSAKKTEMKQARDDLIAKCGSPSSSFHDLSGSATISGVGFFDVIHGQTGVAPNGIELHPVLAVSNLSCSRG